MTFLALLCGVGSASLYYIQPLLAQVAADLRVPTTATGTAMTATQIGNCLGLVLLVPMGDRFDRRRLLMVLTSVAAAALAVAAVSVNLPMLCAALAVLGAAGVLVMLTIPLAAEIAPEGHSGQATGYVMSGMLLGILASRTVAGLVGGVLGWRGMLLCGAGLMIVVLAGITLVLPPSPPKDPPGSYFSLIRSLPGIVRTTPLLRRRMILGTLSFCAFSILWTGLTYGLSASPFGYSSTVIGLFGLAGLAGVIAARGAGTAADRGQALAVTRGSWVLMAAGWGVILAGGLLGGVVGVVFILTGILIFDVGMQGQHITSQSLISQVLPQMRSRGTTAYMTANLIAGAIGSAAAGPLWATMGWAGLCAAGALVSVLALMTCTPAIARVAEPQEHSLPVFPPSPA